MNRHCTPCHTPRRSGKPLRTSLRLAAAAVAACFALGAQANPVDPTVVNGSASFNQSGNVLTVTNSDGAIINWQQFSIAAGETTHFAQPSASSSVLNRVLGGDPSAIYGTLSSNGHVWLVNPAGIMVGPGGRIDVAGFVGSTLNISNADFLASKLNFGATPGAAGVVNQGEITTPSGGSVYLIGGNVSNEGLITTPQGETILAAGQTVQLIDTATPGVKVEITGSEGNATNLGQIVADAGRIGIAGVIVRNSGTLNASSAVSEGGRIFLRASQDAYVDGNGRITTTGTTGGRVEVLGNRVAVMDNAEIDASGANGGGTILVGGDYQGKNPGVQNASISYFGPNASLKADATEVGAGGTVIVWADDTTRAYGSISARGGANGGDGGFVETSGKNYLAVDGIRVDTRAPQGTTGNWLLDPDELTILNGSGTDIGISGGPSIFATASASSTIYGDGIESALGTTNVTLQTSGIGNGNITADGVTINSTAAYGLTLAAYGGGSATGNITLTNSSFSVFGGVTLLAGWDGIEYTSSNVISGTGNIAMSGSLIQSGSSVDLAAGGNITLDRVVAGYGGTINVMAGNAILDGNGSAVNLKAGTINLTSVYGGSAGGLAISSDIDNSDSNVSSLNATVDWTASYGGISLRVAGDSPTNIGLEDFAASKNSIYFSATNDISLDGSQYFATNNDGPITLFAGRDVAITLDPTFDTGGSVIVSAARDLMVDSDIPNYSESFSTSLALIAGQNLTLTSAYISGWNDLLLVGGTVSNQSSWIYAGNDLDILAGSLVNTGQFSAGNDLTFIAGNVAMDGSGEGGSFYAGHDIIGFAAGNITLDNYAGMQAGNDIRLTLTGAGSELSLNNNSYLLAEAITTIYLAFTARSSGGIFLDGVETTTSLPYGSGFFVIGHSTPAVLDSTLFVTYAQPANDAILAILNNNLARAGETEEERRKRLQQSEANGEPHDPADQPVAYCS
ncbi:MAG: hypothetical protein CVU17_11465 [Betaproteobacteria bacterium HGW-Betaproteobacteria-11]|nr:MAG: hypothetical protein CVU17_11465 [Betaproteobacteria bacterium HGW-Betaproteobacteria-11]